MHAKSIHFSTNHVFFVEKCIKTKKAAQTKSLNCFSQSKFQHTVEFEFDT